MELDATKPLVHEFDVSVKGQEDKELEKLTIKVAYQWLPHVCEHCKVFGHATTDYTPLEGVPGKHPSTETSASALVNQWTMVQRKRGA